MTPALGGIWGTGGVQKEQSRPSGAVCAADSLCDISQASAPGWASVASLQTGSTRAGASAGRRPPASGPDGPGPGPQLCGGCLSAPRLPFPRGKRPRGRNAAPPAQRKAEQAQVMRELAAGPGSEPRLFCWPRVTLLGRLASLPPAFPAQSTGSGRARLQLLEWNCSPMLPPGG